MGKRYDTERYHVDHGEVERVVAETRKDGIARLRKVLLSKEERREIERNRRRRRIAERNKATIRRIDPGRRSN